ncbi:hypothetical protein M0R04_10765 [Candidatus Dojkabacteria bacterium]|jgi:hypothetical protein|nr:hypothetical protein [Candidatus Dojkabacteria bacterium]
MAVSFKQRGYIAHALKVNRNMYPELKAMFPPKVENGADISIAELEVKVSKLDPMSVSDVISMLEDDLILEGFNQLNYLINNN